MTAIWYWTRTLLSKPLSLILVVIAFLALMLTIVNAAPEVTTIDLAGGDRIVVVCDGAFIEHDFSAEPGRYDVECDATDTEGTPPSATDVPPTATFEPAATATATPHHEDGFGVCGEYNDRWHPPVINAAYVARWGVGEVGCATGHEHGDNPDEHPWLIAWLSVNEGRDYVSFEHPANTPGENVHKHNAFYLQYGFVQGVEFMHLRHGQSNPHGRCGGAYFGALHSEVTYALDPEGGVTRVLGWLDFGRCDDESLRPGLNEARPENTGHMIVPRPGQTTCESWYNSEHPWLISGGRFFCNSSVYYMGYPEERELSDVADIPEWDATGGVGNHRSWDGNWYEGRLGPYRGEAFWTDQFGEEVTGPDDPRCGALENVMGVSTAVLCMEQIISPTWKSVEFPNNLYQNGTYPASGVVQPNH